MTLTKRKARKTTICLSCLDYFMLVKTKDSRYISMPAIAPLNIDANAPAITALNPKRAIS
jgi:hypothetical protein